MRAFEELCRAQGIDPHQLECAFIDDNTTLQAQNALLVQELQRARGLGAAVNDSPPFAQDDDLAHVLSESLDFVSSKTGYAVRALRSKLGSLLSGETESGKERARRELAEERLRHATEMGQVKETLDMVKRERDALLLQHQHQQEHIQALLSRLESCASRLECSAPPSTCDEVGEAPTRKRDREASVEAGTGPATALEGGGGVAAGEGAGKRSRMEEWTIGGREISPIECAERGFGPKPAEAGPLGSVGLELTLSEGEGGGVVIRRVLAGGTAARSKMDAKEGDEIVSVDGREVRAGEDTVEDVEGWLRGRSGTWARVEVASKEKGSVTAWDLMRGTREFLDARLEEAVTRALRASDQVREEVVEEEMGHELPKDAGGGGLMAGDWQIEGGEDWDERLGGHDREHRASQLGKRERHPGGLDRGVRRLQAGRRLVARGISRLARGGTGGAGGDVAPLAEQCQAKAFCLFARCLGRLAKETRDQQVKYEERLASHDQALKLTQDQHSAALGQVQASLASLQAPAPPPRALLPSPLSTAPAPAPPPAPIHVHVHIQGAVSGQASVTPISPVPLAAAAPSSSLAMAAPVPPPPPPPPMSSPSPAKALPPPPPPPPTVANAGCSANTGAKPDIAAMLRSSPMFNRMRERVDGTSSEH